MLPRWPGDNGGGYNPLLRRTGLSAAMDGLQAMEPPTVTLPGGGSGHYRGLVAVGSLSLAAAGPPRIVTHTASAAALALHAA